MYLFLYIRFAKKNQNIPNIYVFLLSGLERAIYVRNILKIYNNQSIPDNKQKCYRSKLPVIKELRQRG